MLRAKLSDALKDAMRAKDARRVGTLRLVLAAIKDRDIAARQGDNRDGIPDADILSLLQTMIRQRRESIAMYEKGGRADLVTQEQEEIVVIESFLPQQMDDAATEAAARAAIAALGAASIKDMGKVMAHLKAKFAGQMDIGKASAVVKGLLG
jgi:uncharacterized protein YqeY